MNTYHARCSKCRIFTIPSVQVKVLYASKNGRRVMATAIAQFTPKPRQRTSVIERHFFTAIAGTMLVIALAGFVPSLIQTSSRRAPVSPLVAAHGFLFFGWLVIFFVQSRLIATDRVSMHRRVGIAAGLVLALVVPLSFAATVGMVRRGFDLSGDLMRTIPPRLGADVLWVSVFQFGDLLLFTIFAVAAILYRHRPEIHKRLMLFANVALIEAPLTHIPGHTSQLRPFIIAIVQVPVALFLISAILRDWLLFNKVRPLTVSLSVVVFLFGPICANVIGPSAAWHRAAQWLAR